MSEVTIAQRINIMDEQTIQQRLAELEQANAELRQRNSYLEQRLLEQEAELERCAIRQHTSSLNQTQLYIFYLAVEQSASSILITNTDGIIEYVNHRFTEITGYSAEEVLGKTMHMLHSSETPPELLEELWETISAGKRWRGEFRNRKKNGEIYWEGASILPITDSQGYITNYLSISQDITDRKQAEERLQRSEERFRLLAENARDIIFRYRFTEPRGFEYVSPSVESIMGFTPEEYYADPDIDLKRLHPDSHATFSVGEQSANSYREQVIMRYIRKDGRDVWIEQNHYQVVDEKGRTIAIEGISRDITDRKRAEDALRNNLHFLETLLNTIPSPVFYQDMEGHYRGFNRLFGRQILGLTDESLSLYDDGNLVNLQMIDTHVELDQELINGHSPQVYISKVQCADGVLRDFLLSRATFVDADGKIAGIVGVMQDITERIRIEAKLLEAHRKLEALVGRLQDELNLAHRIQQSLLPPPIPNWDGPDTVCYSVPARKVGGDWYVYHSFHSTGTLDPVSQQRYGIAVGDVSGKGMSAALLMTISLASFRSVVSLGLRPGVLLECLDDAINEYTVTTHQNCAFIYAELLAMSDYVYGPRTYRLRVANAGCMSPLLRRAGQGVEWIDVGGLPLGVGVHQDTGYEEVEVVLSAGDTLVFSSDGLVEAMNAAHELFGFHRLEEAVASGPQTSAAAMLDHLRRAVEAFVGDIDAHDDLTMIVVQL